MLKAAIEQYQGAKTEKFASHALADMIRNKLPKELEKWITDNQRYICKGSPGQGTWADVPWVAVFDRLITETAQSGYYLVYLMSADGKSVYLSLNQGVTALNVQYGVPVHHALKVRAKDLLARIDSPVNDLITEPISLAVDETSRLASLYQHGSIIARRYDLNAFPDNDEVKRDFCRFMLLYEALSSREGSIFANSTFEDDEQDFELEDVRNLREHKRIERNRTLAKKAKEFHGYICKACGFDFKEKYGELGKDFIEAHHLTPLSSLKGTIAKLSPEYDFTVLCSNCHRMIHRAETVNNVREFREKYILD